MQIQNVRLFNGTSREMSEVEDNTVDIIVFAPPYNIKTPYGEETSDAVPFEDFRDMLEGVVKECCRVLKPGGRLLSESADTIYSDGKLIALSDLIQSLFLSAGLALSERHINFLQSENGVVLKDKEHNWTEDYYSEEEAHSNCHQWLLFEKGGGVFNIEAGKIHYVNYPSDEEGHPCPFSSEHVHIFLEMTGFMTDMVVLESFMGTGRLGEEVVARKGKYVGYEIVKKHYITAKSRFEKSEGFHVSRKNSD